MDRIERKWKNTFAELKKNSGNKLLSAKHQNRRRLKKQNKTKIKHLSLGMTFHIYQLLFLEALDFFSLDLQTLLHLWFTLFLAKLAKLDSTIKCEAAVDAKVVIETFSRNNFHFLVFISTLLLCNNKYGLKHTCTHTHLHYGRSKHSILLCLFLAYCCYIWVSAHAKNLTAKRNFEQ